MTGVTAIKLDGKLYREEIFADLQARVTRLKEKHGVAPGLATVLVGEDPASQNYVRMKHKDCEELGIASIMKELPGDCTQDELDAVIEELNNDDACTGYIVQLPLPKHLNENRVLSKIDPEKDVDGLHPENLGKLVLNEEAPLPCTPNGAIGLLRRFGVAGRFGFVDALFRVGRFAATATGRFLGGFGFFGRFDGGLDRRSGFHFERRCGAHRDFSRRLRDLIGNGFQVLGLTAFGRGFSWLRHVFGSR